MLSIIIYVLLICATGMLYSIIRFDRGLNKLLWVNIAALYLMTRVFPLAMLEHKERLNYILLIVDSVVLLFVLQIIRRVIKQVDYKNYLILVLLLNPLPAICITVNNLVCSMIAFTVTLFIAFEMLLAVTRNSGKGKIKLLSIGVVGLWISVLGLIYARVELLQDFGYMFNKGGKPSFMLIAKAMFVAFVFFSVRAAIWETKQPEKLLTTDNSKDPETSEGACNNNRTKKSNKNADRRYRHDRIDVIDVSLMIAFSLLFGILSIYKLGSTTMPTSSFRFTDENRELVLDFGEEKGIAKLYFFQDYKTNDTISFSVANQTTGKWEVIVEKGEYKRAFKWYNENINKFTRYLGIVCSGSNIDKIINELVVIDEKGNKLKPVNVHIAENLFDEQEKLPEYISYYDHTMFDEVYHARTAYEFVNGYSIYENTHPPLGKTIIGYGIRAFGMNPFGFRFMSFVAGLLCIPIFYLFGIKITKERAGGVFAALLLGTECMHFVLSRIATLDIFVALFIVLMFYVMYCYIEKWETAFKTNKQVSLENDNKPNKSLYMIILIDGIFTGIGIAIKWTAMYAAAGLCVLFFIAFFEKYNSFEKMKANIRSIIGLGLWCVLCYIIIPCIIYVNSYAPFKRVYGGTNLSNAIGNIKLAFSYHNGLKFEHSYSSEWYEWIIDKQPLLDAYNSVKGGKVSSVATFGSPLIVWGGLLALIYVGYLWRCNNDKIARFLCIMYLSSLMPWMLVHRTVFIYHYYPCILALILILTYAIARLSRGRKLCYLITGLIAVGIFCLYFSEISGMPVSKSYIDNVLELFDTWIFA